MKVYTLSTRNRPLGIITGLVVVGAGVALVTIGLAILAGLVLAGGVLGAGILAYRALRGKRHEPLRGSAPMSGLDPALEVFVEPSAIDPSRAPNDERPRIGPS